LGRLPAWRSLFARLLVDKAKEALRQGRSQTITVLLPTPQSFFVDILGQAPDLVIAGAGHIARPFCEMASICGYRVAVVDDRGDYARSDFFPRAQRVICDDFARAFQEYPWGSLSHVVLITRGHKHDEECLRQLIGKELAYIGMIGSRRRTRAVLDELAAEGVRPEWLTKIYAPIGIDIGAQTPEEISVAILAEMINVRRGGRARSLSLSP
jgi:xanthine dehydrogenase accessory factor